MITVLKSADETCQIPVTRVRVEGFSSGVEEESSSANGTGGAWSAGFSAAGALVDCAGDAVSVTGGVAAAVGVCGLAGREWRKFHHTPAPNTKTRTTNRTITARMAVGFGFFAYS